MDIEKLSEPLTIDQIEFRIKSINYGGYAHILAYKNARADQQRLDDVAGPLNWERVHTNGNRNCIVRIWCSKKQTWVSKEDVGTESNTEKEKGLASDSFKRACFNWGIGRELYDYPAISVKLFPDEFTPGDKQKREKPKATWNLKIQEWSWVSQFKNGKISFLAARYDGKIRFKYGEYEK